MIKIIFLLFTVTFACAEVFFEPFYAQGESKRDFSWDIAGANGVPSVLSKLNWKNITSKRQDFGINILHPRIEINIYTSTTSNSSGEVNDYDYNPLIHSRSSAKGSKFTKDAVLIGPRIGNIKSVELVLQGAYTRSIDTYKLSNGVEISPSSGKIDGLNSTYKAKVNGFGGSAKARYSPYPNYGSVLFGWQQFIYDYQAKANWNLRTDISSFEHSGTAYEQILWAEIEAKLPRKISLFAKWEERRYRVNRGTDKTTYQDGTRTTQPLNGVSLMEHSLLFGIKGRF